MAKGVVTFDDLDSIGLDPDQIDAAREASRSSVGSGAFKLKLGKSESKPAHNLVRPVGRVTYRQIHSLSTLAQNTGIPSVLVCPKHFDGDNYCPVCRYGWSLWRDAKDKGSKRQEALAKQILPKDRYLVLILVREDEEWEDEDGIAIPTYLEFGRMIWKDYEVEWRKYGNPGDPDEGYIIDIEAWQENPQQPRSRGYKCHAHIVGKGRSAEVSFDPIDDDERELEFEDLSTRFAEMTDEHIQKLDSLLFSEGSRKKKVQDLEEDEEEIDTDANRLACFGDPDEFDPDDDECMSCDDYDECMEEVGSGEEEEEEPKPRKRKSSRRF